VTDPGSTSALEGWLRKEVSSHIRWDGAVPDTQAVEGPPFGVIEAVPGVEVVTYEPRFSAICLVGQAPFGGTLVISFRPGPVLLEFESFEAWLRSISTELHTIESFGKRVFDVLVEALRCPYLEVKVRAKTQVHAPVAVTFVHPS